MSGSSPSQKRYQPVSCALALLVSLAVSPAADTVSYEKYALSNGMKVILVEDHKLPLVVINTWFYVGAKDEPAGRSGFAHLFEHLMFMGTERVPVGQFDRIMERGGGFNNASTDFDRTNYFSSGPAELLPTLLWLDADRLEDLGRAMTSEKLDAQRAIVRNERRQSVENVPYGKSDLKIVEMLFPEGHPYHFEVIGSHEDLESAAIDDVKEFFANFYVPNNASLVVCGDFDPAEIKVLIADQFGTLLRGADPPRRDLAVRNLQHEERFTMLDLVDAPMVKLAWHAPRAWEEGDAEMRLLERILGEGRNGRLYRRLVIDEALASGIDVNFNSLIARSMFSIDVRPLPGADLDRVESIVLEELAKIREGGVTAEELDRARAREELAILENLETLLGKADKMNEYEFFTGEPDGFRDDIARLRRVNLESLRAGSTAVFGTRGRAVVRVLPLEPQKLASPRDTRPTDLATRPFALPKPETIRLANSLRVQVYEYSELPRVELRLTLEAPGGRLDEEKLPGVGKLLVDLLLEGAGEKDGVAFAEALAGLGAEIDVSAQRDRIHIDLSTPSSTFEPAMELLAELVLRPRLDPVDFERVKTLALEDLKARNAQPRAIAAQVADRMLFGTASAFGVPVSGWLDSIARVKLEDVTTLRARLFDPAKAHVFVAGNVDTQELESLLASRFEAWHSSGEASGGKTHDRSLAPTPGDSLRVFLVDRPGAVQTMIHFAMPGPSHASDARIATEMLGVVLGGSFTSRLNQNLREDKGYTYGARCGLRPEKETGSIVASSAVRADVTGAALGEFLKELAKIRTGDVTEEEFARAGALYRTRAIGRFEGLRESVETLSELARFGETVEAIQHDVQSVRALERAAVNVGVNAMLPLETGVLVLVGDATTVLSQIADLRLAAPIRVTAEGETAGLQ